MNAKIKTSLAALLIVITSVFLPLHGYAMGSLPLRSLELSSAYPAATGVQYILAMTTTIGYTLGSIQVEFCQEGPLQGTPCTGPVGFTAANAVILSQAGQTGFSVSPLSTANNLILTRSASFANPGPIALVLGQIRNPDNVGEHFARISTYIADDATGTDIDFGGIAFAISQPMIVSLEVPPYLYFCVAQAIPGYDCSLATSSFIDFGELSSTSTKTGTSQFVVATNGQYGVNILVTGTTLTSGNNIIPPLLAQAASQVGTSQFGINLVANNGMGFGADPVGQGIASPNAGYNTPGTFKFVSGDAVAFSNLTTAEKKFTVSYIANVNKNQRPGTYNTTLVYNALASF